MLHVRHVDERLRQPVRFGQADDAHVDRLLQDREIFAVRRRDGLETVPRKVLGFVLGWYCHRAANPDHGKEW